VNLYSALSKNLLTAKFVIFRVLKFPKVRHVHETGKVRN